MKKVFLVLSIALTLAGCDSLESRVKPFVHEDAEINGLREGRDGAVCGEVRRPGALWHRVVVVDEAAHYSIDVITYDHPSAEVYKKYCL